jgi:hydroxymethylpyrimidine/phosphomethylpyrimidine kinase
MNATDGRKLIEAVLNERRCRVVKMGLGGATIAETAKALRDRNTHGVCEPLATTSNAGDSRRRNR